MTCAKKTVLAVILSPEGEVLGWGSNACAAPQPTCPREPGEGYEKCVSICKQPSHAEGSAIINTMRHYGHVPKGATCRVLGIDRICGECQAMLDEFDLVPVIG